MEKLPMCRICLVENVRMSKVVNRNLHELYEKLTDIPFVTEDSRPTLACFVCCTKLKQCCRFVRTCLEAKEQFAQMTNGDYEPNPLINQNCLELYSGFIKSPVEQISIVDECQTESIAIKEELPAVCEGLDDIVETKEEHQSNEHEPETDLEDEVPLIEFKTEVEEEEVTRKKRRASETIKHEPETLDNRRLGVADMPPHCSESDLKDDAPLTYFKTEVEEEVTRKKQRASETISATVSEKPNLDRRKTTLEDAITAEKTAKGKSDSKVIRTAQIRTSEPGTYFKEPYKCDQRSFERVKNMIHRTSTHTGEKPYKCDVCQRSFNDKSKLTYHARVHTGEKPYKCDVCQRSFNHKSTLTNHIRIHTGEKLYKCDICQRSFNRKGHLTRHIPTHTDEKPYKCDICGRSFCVNAELTRHTRIHNGEKPFKCDLCQLSFNRNSHLTNHIRVHTGEKPYKCNVCQRSFNRNSHLTRHISIHTGEKPYKCDVCQRSFSNKRNLTNHIRLHTGEKPYKCDICERSFSVNAELTKHTRRHTVDKPYKCDVCQLSFNRTNHLTNHIRVHTGEKPYKCDICGSSFSQFFNLKRHKISNSHC